jgi:hypothetical protein
MARRIPLVAAGILHVHEPAGGPGITVDSPAWAGWLKDPATRSFSFRSSSGTFTARKERRSGGDEYWSAYRKLGGKLRKVYLGKAEKLTLAKLEEAATALSGRGEVRITDDAEPTRADGAGREATTRLEDHARESARTYKAIRSYSPSCRSQAGAPPSLAACDLASDSKKRWDASSPLSRRQPASARPPC